MRIGLEQLVHGLAGLVSQRLLWYIQRVHGKRLPSGRQPYPSSGPFPWLRVLEALDRDGLVSWPVGSFCGSPHIPANRPGQAGLQGLCCAGGLHFFVKGAAISAWRVGLASSTALTSSGHGGATVWCGWSLGRLRGRWPAWPIKHTWPTEKRKSPIASCSTISPNEVRPVCSPTGFSGSQSLLRQEARIKDTSIPHPSVDDDADENLITNFVLFYNEDEVKNPHAYRESYTKLVKWVDDSIDIYKVTAGRSR